MTDESELELDSAAIDGLAEFFYDLGFGPSIAKRMAERLSELGTKEWYE